MTDSIGLRLKKARESRHLTLEQVAEETRIRQGYLQALEADDYSNMPSPVHARGFLRNYSQYLELDMEQILEEIRAAESTTDSNVVFEGEKTVPAPARKEPEPEPGAEAPVEETPAEPFWQIWLRRAKKEVGELDEKGSDVSQPEAPVSPADQIEQHEAKPPVALPEADQTRETKAAQDIDSETYSNGTKADLLVERMKSLVKRKQPKPVEPLEKREKPEPEPPLPEPESEPEPEPEIPAEPAAASQEIVNEIATQLRRRREMLSLTLEEIERHTRLRVEIMEALEKGNFDELPSPVQTRGMLANYAGFLDLDVDALLLRFADALQARHRERHPEKPARRRGQPKVPESLPKFRSLIAGDVVFGVGMVLLLIGFSIWGISRVIALQSEQDSNGSAESSGPSISEALIGSPVPTVLSEVTLIPAADTPIPGATEQVEGTAEEGTIEVPTLDANVNVQVNIVALERSFLRVTVDGELAFEGRTIPGNAYPFQGEQSVEILAGNGSALRVIYNQRDLGLLGGFGQIASFIYTADEIITPTPAMSPTVTNTPFISPTPSITPSPTVTPSPTLTPTNLPVNE